MKKVGNDEKENNDEMVDNTKELYSLILENANDFISIINEKLEYEFVNEKAYLRILGYSEKELIGKTRTDLIHPDDLQNGLEVIRKAFNSETYHQTEGRFKHKDGHYIWCEVRGKSFIDEKGEKKGLIIGRDISETKIAEIELKELNEELERRIEKRTSKLTESEEKYRLLVENLNDLVTIYNSEIKFEFINENAHLKILGYSWNDLIGKSPMKFLHPDDKKFIIKAFENIEIKKEIQVEARLRRKDGIYIWVDINGRIFKDTNGEIKVYLLGRNVDDRKKAERRLLKSEFEYRVASDKAEFYKDLLAHDFSNIFQNILSTTELAISYLNDTYKAKEKLIAITKQVERAGRLNSNIRILSEIDKKKSKLKSINVKAYLDNSINFVRDSFSGKKLNIQVNFLEDNLEVQANELLYDVFENILINAIQHNNNEKINIEIKATKIQESENNYIKMEFMDNGMGIHDNMKKDIFNRGFREERSIRGMGIGLSLLKRIMKNYDGEIFAQDKISGDYTKGSNFVVLLREVDH